MAKLVLEINGQRYAGWKKVRVRRTLDEMADAFTVDYTDNWGGEAIPIQEGDSAKVYVERTSGSGILESLTGGDPRGTRILTGYVDDANQTFDEKSRTLTITGRSLTGDLVDCSAIYRNRQIRGKTLTQIAAMLAEPFGIDVSLAPVVLANLTDLVHTPLRRFVLQPGETVEQSLIPIAKKLGLLLISDTAGGLVITRGSAAVAVSTSLVEGVNIKRASYRASWKSRYQDYTFRSQMATDGDWHGTDANQAKGHVTDDAITRYRPLELVAESQGDRKDLERRAVWERNSRAGKGQQLTLTVPGWEHADGVWELNTLVRVKSPWLRIDDELLIAGVEFGQDRQSGTTTTLTIVGQGAYDILGAPPKLRNRLFEGGVIGKLARAL